MNEKNKKWLIYVVIAVVSYMLGAWLSTKEVEVEKIVKVEKIVEKKNNPDIFKLFTVAVDGVIRGLLLIWLLTQLL